MGFSLFQRVTYFAIGLFGPNSEEQRPFLLTRVSVSVWSIGRLSIFGAEFEGINLIQSSLAFYTIWLLGSFRLEHHVLGRGLDLDLDDNEYG